MQQFLDASGLNLYHQQVKEIFDSSIIALQNGDIGIAGAIGTLVNDIDTGYSRTRDKLDILIDEATLLRLTSSHNNIFVGEESTLSITAISKNSATSIVIKNGSGDVIASGSGISLVGSTTVTPGSEGILGFTATAVVNGKSLNAKVYVNCVGKVYYGSGSVYTDASTYASERTTPQGVYNVTVNNNGDYIYIVVPSSMTIAKVSMNGVNIPMNVTDVTIGGISYKAYQSKNQYIAGTYEVIVDSQNGGVLNVADINTSDDVMTFGDKQYKLIPVVEE
jgi:hypothetical protein